MHREAYKSPLKSIVFNSIQGIKQGVQGAILGVFSLEFTRSEG